VGIIVVVFLFSAARMSADDNQIDKSPKYAIEDESREVKSAPCQGHSKAKKGRRKKIHSSPQVTFQSKSDFMNAHSADLTEWELEELDSYTEIYYYQKANHSLEFYEEYDREALKTVVPGDHIDYRYEVLEWLGCGGVGSVLLAEDHAVPQDDPNRKVAIKSYDPKRNEIAAWAQEKYFSETLQQSTYPEGFVLFLREFSFRIHHYLVFQLQGASLDSEFKTPHNETILRKFARDMVKELAAMHELDMVHYDIKPANYMYVPESSKDSDILLRLGDFSSSCQGKTGDYPCVWVPGKIRTRGYNAPEMLLGMDFDQKADMFSLGISLLELFNGAPPFPAPSDEINLAELIRTFGNFPQDMIKEAGQGQKYIEAKIQGLPGLPPFTPGDLPLWNFFNGTPSSNFYSFIESCLVINPADRMSSGDALKHPFLDSSYFHGAL